MTDCLPNKNELLSFVLLPRLGLERI